MRSLLRSAVLTGLLALAAIGGAATVAGCSHNRGWAEVDVYGTDGFRHHGYYDDRNDWHGGWYDNDHRFHDDPHDWRDRDWHDGRR